jgi:hypothetical protein
MNISEEALQEFKAIYLAEYGRELADSEAEEKAEQLLSLFVLLLRTPPPCADPSDAHRSCG